jgi:hypothetical protein
MPNWCTNVVNITHDDITQLERARDAFARGEFLQEFIPCPQSLRDTAATHYPEGHADKAAHDALVAENVKQHGFANWYDWQVSHWGTKWDFGDEDGADLNGDVLSLSFDSAWAPPCDAYDRLEDLGFRIEAFYYEPGMAFCGSWINGVDNCIDIPGTSAEAEQVIPTEIDEMFGIVENMIQWEEDERAWEAESE